jgi:GNAT superfamily N-acetyltransferase
LAPAPYVCDQLSKMVKTASLSELADLVPLFDAYRQFYKQDTDVKGAEEFLRQRLLANESIIFIFYDKNKALGFTQLYPIFSSVAMKRAWLLNDLYVHPDGRRKGVATALLERAKLLGRDTDATWLLLSTGAANTAAKTVYRQNGWKEVNDSYFEFILS